MSILCYRQKVNRYFEINKILAMSKVGSVALFGIFAIGKLTSSGIVIAAVVIFKKIKE